MAKKVDKKNTKSSDSDNTKVDTIAVEKDVTFKPKKKSKKIEGEDSSEVSAVSKEKKTKKRKKKNKIKLKDETKPEQPVDKEETKSEEPPQTSSEKKKKKSSKQVEDPASTSEATAPEGLEQTENNEAPLADESLSKKQQKKLWKQQRKEAAKVAAAEAEAAGEPEGAKGEGKKKKKKKKKHSESENAPEEKNVEHKEPEFEAMWTKAERRKNRLKIKRERKKQDENVMWRQNLQRIRRELRKKIKKTGSESEANNDNETDDKEEDKEESSEMTEETVPVLDGVKGSIRTCNKNMMELPAIITHDSRHILVASGRDVLIYNMETALVEKTFRGHLGRVIHMKNDPNDPLQMVSVSDKKEVLVWDYEDCSIKKKLSLPVPVTNVVLHPTDCTKMICSVKVSDVLGYRAILYTEKLKKFCEAKSMDQPIYMQKKRKHMVPVKNKVVDKVTHKIKWVTEKEPQTMYTVSVTVDGKEHISEERPTITYATEEAAHKALKDLEVVKGNFSKNVIEKNLQLTYLDLTDPSKTRNCSTRSEYGIPTKCYSFTQSGEGVVFLRGRNLQYFKPGTITKRFTSGRSFFTCLAVHPKSDEIIATGDNFGVILVWFNMPTNAKHVRLHWHSYSVSDMEFSQQGDHLTSGGEESCLVTWQLEKQTNKVTPRIGAPIHHIRRSEDGQYLAVTFVNNQVHVYAAETSNKRNAILGFSRGQSATRAAYDPSTRCIAAVGSPAGVVQFYKPSEDRIVKSVDIVGENRVNKLRDDERYEDAETQVKLVSFSQDGGWMVTSEHRRDKLLGDERKLKFWKYNAAKEFELNTMVDPPHTDDVTSIVFQPVMMSTSSQETSVVLHSHSNPNPGKCLTACKDGEFKLWSLETNSQVNKEGVTQVTQTWMLHSIGKHVKEPIKDVSFSHDGNFVAIVQNEIHVWSLHPRLHVTTTLGTNTLREDIKHAMFGSRSSHLVGHTRGHILCWSGEDFSLLWCVQASVYSLSRDPFTECFVAIALAPGSGRTAMLDAYVFKGDSPKPVTCYYRIGTWMTCQSQITSTLFLPREASDDKHSDGKDNKERSSRDRTVPKDVISDMYVIGDNCNIGHVAELCKQKRVNDTSTKLARQETEIEQIFKLKTNPKKFQQEEDDSKAHTMKGSLSTMMATPSHILPSMDAMFRTFATVSMTSKKERKSSTSGGDSSDEDDDEEDSSSDEDEEKTKSPSSTEQLIKTTTTTPSMDVAPVADTDSSDVNLNFNFSFQSSMFSS